MRYFFIAVGLFLISQCAIAQKIGDQVQLVSSEDREMNQAIEKAQKTLDQFLVLAKIHLLVCVISN